MNRRPPRSTRTDTPFPSTTSTRSTPEIETFPGGDLARLVASAGGLERACGGTPFPGAQADIIRTYIGWLAAGNGRADFLTAYAGFLGQYLDLIRSGAAPSSFESASLGNINAFLAYAGRTGRPADLGSHARVDRTSCVCGKSVSVVCDLGGRGSVKKKKKK